MSEVIETPVKLGPPSYEEAIISTAAVLWNFVINEEPPPSYEASLKIMIENIKSTSP